MWARNAQSLLRSSLLAVQGGQQAQQLRYFNVHEYQVRCTSSCL